MKFHWGYAKELIEEVRSGFGFPVLITYYGVSVGAHFFGYLRVQYEA